jgi:hypothetical protein
MEYHVIATMVDLAWKELGEYYYIAYIAAFVLYSEYVAMDTVKTGRLSGLDHLFSAAGETILA